MRIVEAYFEAMQIRDVAAAAQYWGPSVEVIGVGRSRYTDLTAMVADTAKRYQYVAKHRIDYLEWSHQEHVHVVSLGSLYGTLVDGTEFDGVAYVDIFVLRNNLISRQEFFNDFGVGLDQLLSKIRGD